MFLPRRFFFPTGLLLLFLSLFLVSQSPLQRFLESFVGQTTAHLLGASNFFVRDVIALSRSSSLVSENRNLREKLMASEQSVALLQEGQREAERLIVLQQQKEVLHPLGIVCRVMGRDPAQWRRLIFLDKGEGEGLRTTMTALGPQGLVGQVVEVHPGWSKVLLITDPESKIGALLERSRESGLVVGQPNGLLTLEYLSPGADVQEGDRVLTGGFGKRFPKGILIGEVIGFGHREGDLLSHAWVRPSEPVSKLEEVLCIEP